jgi:hypothetical protein
MLNKFKGLLNHDIIFQSLLVVLVGVVSFGLGRMSTVETTQGSSVAVYPTVVSTAPPLSVTNLSVPESVPSEQATSLRYVGSRNGTKFHLLTCPGANSIKEENKVYFNSKQEAYSRGYTEAANCKGI